MATINDDIARITEAIKNAVPVEKIYLFGSYAYGTSDDNSDYDFYIVIPDGMMRPIKAMQDAHIAIVPLGINKSIDVLASTSRSFIQMRDIANCVEREVAQKGILLYEQQ